MNPQRHYFKIKYVFPGIPEVQETIVEAADWEEAVELVMKEYEPISAYCLEPEGFQGVIF